MVVDLLIVLICLVITGFARLIMKEDIEFEGGSLFQYIKWLNVYVLIFVASALPLIAVVLGYKYLIASGY